MADDPYNMQCLLAAFVLLLHSSCSVGSDEHNVVYSSSRPCTYFGGTRVSQPMGNLVNCSWYANNACCKRTEVTSVFGSMYPLYGATETCKNQINYMMCYFCSPFQYKWFRRRVRVCSEFCESVYAACKTASYHGTTIGEAYVSGQQFCEGQKFEVTEGNVNCFDFDPTVFNTATVIGYSCLCMFLTALSFIVSYNVHHIS